MRRPFIITTILLFCALHSFRGAGPCAATPPLSTAGNDAHSPLSVCRYKRPFPFQCTLLAKKRLSNPPLPEQTGIYPGYLLSSPVLHDGLTGALPLFVSFLPEGRAATRIPGPVFRLLYCSIRRNVFHPPPGLA